MNEALYCIATAVACLASAVAGYGYGISRGAQDGKQSGEKKWLSTPKDVRPKKNKRYTLVSDQGTTVRVVAADSERVMFVSDEDNIVHEVPAASFSDCFKECQ